MKIQEKVYKFVDVEELNSCIRSFLRRQGCTFYENFDFKKYDEAELEDEFYIFVSSNIGIVDQEELIQGKFDQFSAESVLNWMADHQEICAGHYVVKIPL